MGLPKVIYVMGAPGAGKGTQAEKLAQAIGYVRFSTGDAFRHVARQDTPLGRRVKETIDNGYLAPPEMAAEIVIAAVREHVSAGKGLVFDGTPRTVPEAKIVDEFFADREYGRPLVIYLNVDREEVMRRNSVRRFCLGIDGDFPIVSLVEEERCRERGGTVGIRADDAPEKFATRWDEFMRQTYPVVESYRSEGIVYEISGMKSIDEVHAEVMVSIRSLDGHAA